MSNDAREKTLWSTTAAARWLEDAEMDDELREAVIEAMQELKNNKKKKEKLRKRIEPYQSRLYASSLNKVVRVG